MLGGYDDLFPQRANSFVKPGAVTRLLDDLNIGHAGGSYQNQRLHLSKKDLLILDDWGLEKLNARQASDLLEVMEDRYQRGSTIISQLPVGEWYKLIGNPTVADALMDRLLHNGHRVDLRGESMRKLAQIDGSLRGFCSQYFSMPYLLI